MTLALKIANQPLSRTLWLIMMHHRTKFGNKIFVGFEDIIWTNIDILTFAVTLTLIAVTHFFHIILWLMMLYHYIMFGNKMFCGSEHIIQTIIHSHFKSLP